MSTLRKCQWCGEQAMTSNYWGCCAKHLQREYDDGEGYSIQDDAQNAPLVDGFELHALIGSDGDTTFWVTSPGVEAKCKGGGEWPKHELTGRLPDEYKYRVLRARCGRMTRSGKPCRNLPTCRYHR